MKDGKILPYWKQLTQPRVVVAADLQSTQQKDAYFVGSAKCQECHKEKFDAWSHSRYPKMIQDPKKSLCYNG